MKLQYRVMEISSPSHYGTEDEQETKVRVKKMWKCNDCGTQRYHSHTYENITEASFLRLNRIAQDPPDGIFRTMYIWNKAIGIDLYRYSYS